ncbi:MAG: GxxExxY protein [Bacteroidia bacterium]
MEAKLKRRDLLFPEISYTIMGCAFDVFNQIGPGHLEKVYQKAMAAALREKKLLFNEQVPHVLRFNGEKVGSGYFDFLVEEKIVVELKRGRFYLASDMEQVNEYLKMSNKKLGIIIRFTPDAVCSKESSILASSIVRLIRNYSPHL